MSVTALILAEILHEALHTLLGAGEHVLRPGNAGLEALSAGGCNVTGHAKKNDQKNNDTSLGSCDYICYGCGINDGLGYSF